MDEHCQQGQAKTIYEIARLEAEWLIAFAGYVPAQQALGEDNEAHRLACLQFAARQFASANPGCSLTCYELAQRLADRAIKQGPPKLSIKPQNRIAEYYQD